MGITFSGDMFVWLFMISVLIGCDNWDYFKIFVFIMKSFDFYDVFECGYNVVHD